VIVSDASGRKEIPVQPTRRSGWNWWPAAAPFWATRRICAFLWRELRPGQFLYDSPSSAALQNMPVAGRSFAASGEGRAGLRRLQWRARWRGLLAREPQSHDSHALVVPRPDPNELTDIEDADGKPPRSSSS